MKKIEVSVALITYNQEKTISQSIESVLNQNIPFKIELLIGDDCSVDNTLSICREYQKKYPKIIKVVSHRQNGGSTKNMYDLLKISHGKYITFLEGDDYWYDNKKLQKQVDFLKKHPQYVACAHDLYDVNDNVIIGKHNRTNCKVIKFKNIAHGKLNMHMNSVLARNIFDTENVDLDKIYQIDRIVGDRTLALYITDFGNVYMLPEVMGCYRVCINRYHKTVYQEMSGLIKFVNNLSMIKFVNHKLNTQYYKVSIIMDYFLLSFLNKEKIRKKEKKDMLSNITWNDYYLIPVRLFEYLIMGIKKGLHRIRGWKNGK